MSSQAARMAIAPDRRYTPAATLKRRPERGKSSRAVALKVAMLLCNAQHFAQSRGDAAIRDIEGAIDAHRN